MEAIKTVGKVLNAGMNAGTSLVTEPVSFISGFWHNPRAIPPFTAQGLQKCARDIFSYLSLREVLCFSGCCTFTSNGIMIPKELVQQFLDASKLPRKMGQCKLRVSSPLSAGNFRRFLHTLNKTVELNIAIDPGTGHVVLDAGSAFANRSAFLSANFVPPLSVLQQGNSKQTSSTDYNRKGSSSSSSSKRKSNNNINNNNNKSQSPPGTSPTSAVGSLTTAEIATDSDDQDDDDDDDDDDEPILKQLEVASYDEYDDFNPRHPNPRDLTTAKGHRRGGSLFNSDIAELAQEALLSTHGHIQALDLGALAAEARALEAGIYPTLQQPPHHHHQLSTSLGHGHGDGLGVGVGVGQGLSPASKKKPGGRKSRVSERLGIVSTGQSDAAVQSSDEEDDSPRP